MGEYDNSGTKVTPLRIDWDRGYVEYLDQRYLPHKEIWVKVDDAESTCRAIKDMILRGAPLIGVAGALGVYLQARRCLETGKTNSALITELLRVINELSDSRPTAVNLKWALNRVKELIHKNIGCEPEELVKLLEAEVKAIIEYEREVCAKMAQHAKEFLTSLVPNLRNVLTHCNTGALATTGIGTALGVIRKLAEDRDIFVWVDETRPYLQGARLTAWELQKDGINFKIIVDSCACYLMSRGQVDAVIVGADRITRSGDTANKIGTLALAVSANRYDIPFIVVAPRSSIDLNLKDGSSIPIEERSQEEVLNILDTRIAPLNCEAFNPGFDVTPGELISAIITEEGVYLPPFDLG